MCEGKATIDDEAALGLGNDTARGPRSASFVEVDQGG